MKTPKLLFANGASMSEFMALAAVLGTGQMPAKAVMHHAQKCYIENIGITACSLADVIHAKGADDGYDIMDAILKNPPASTIAGVPIECDASFPTDVIEFRDGNNFPIAVIRGLAGPTA